MSTHDVPGARPENRDVLKMGAWAEHPDGSLIVVESVEAGRVIYSIFDLGVDPPVEYRDAMPENVFKDRFTWKPKDILSIKWTWHDKTPFNWDRVMRDFPPGQRHVSARETMTVAARVAESLKLRAGAIRRRQMTERTQKAASHIMQGIKDAVGSLRS